MNKQFKTKNIIWTCYPVNSLEHFEKNEIPIPPAETKKLTSDAIPNPNVPKQFVFPAKIMKGIKVYKKDMFGTPLKSSLYNIGKTTFRFVDLGDYDSNSSYQIGNIVSFSSLDKNMSFDSSFEENTNSEEVKQFVNLVVIPGVRLTNPITDGNAWAPFSYAD